MGIDGSHYINGLLLLFSQWLSYLCSIGAWGIFYFQSKPGKRNYTRSQDKVPELLPVELIERVADFLFEVTYPYPSDQKSDRTSMLSLKPSWVMVAGFMSASVDLHNIGMKQWVQ
ncbi:hypothetical protein FRC11_004388, partial [Ceratobasidium sp. 423]